MESEAEPLLSTNTGYIRRNNYLRKLPFQRKVQISCVAILFTEILERIAFYSIVGNFVIFLTQYPLGWMSYDAIVALFIFTGICYISSIGGGLLADTLFGRFKAIVASLILYIFGYIFLPFLTPYPNPNNIPSFPPSWCASNTSTSGSVFSSQPCSWTVYLSIVIIGISVGTFKANIAPFGADQVKQHGLQATRTFFNWFYWCINVGALISLGAIAYVQQEISFFWGFIAAHICLVIGTIIFSLGGFFYVMQPRSGSMLANVFRILVESCRSKNNNSLIESSQSHQDSSFLRMAKVENGGSFDSKTVDGVKQLGKILIIFTALIPYWIVYYQMETTFVVQSLHMKLFFGTNGVSSNSFKIAAAWLSLFDVIFIFLLIPLMDRVVYPLLDRHGYQLTLRTRITVGMLFAVFSVAVAGGIETFRLSVYWKNGTANSIWQTIGHTNYSAADVSVLYMIPQYSLMGTSEVFASIAGIELAYSEAPRSMQGIIMGFFWFSQGVGSILGTLIIRIFEGVWFFGWDHGDINCRIPCKSDPAKVCHNCHLDYYFYFLAVFLVFGLLIFVLISNRLKIGGKKRVDKAKT